MSETSLFVPDISCGHCKSAIEGAVKKLASVSSVEVDVATKRVHVVYDPPVALDEVVGAIESQGYEVKRE